MFMAFLLSLSALFRALKVEPEEKTTAWLIVLWSAIFGAGRIFWVLRAALFDASAPVADWWGLWQGVWIVTFLSGVFVTWWGVALQWPEHMKSKTWLVVIFFIPWLIVTLDVLFINNPSIATVASYAYLDDVQPDLLHLLFGAVGILMALIPGFVYFGKDLSTAERKGVAALVLFAWILMAFGIILDGKLIMDDLLGMLGRFSIGLGFLLMLVWDRIR
jgi:hypothetical protein